MSIASCGDCPVCCGSGDLFALVPAGGGEIFFWCPMCEGAWSAYPERKTDGLTSLDYLAPSGVALPPMTQVMQIAVEHGFDCRDPIMNWGSDFACVMGVDPINNIRWYELALDGAINLIDGIRSDRVSAANAYAAALWGKITANGDVVSVAFSRSLAARLGRRRLTFHKVLSAIMGIGIDDPLEALCPLISLAPHELDMVRDRAFLSGHFDAIFAAVRRDVVESVFGCLAQHESIPSEVWRANSWMIEYVACNLPEGHAAFSLSHDANVAMIAVRE